MRSALSLLLILLGTQCLADTSAYTPGARIVDFGIFLTSVDGTAPAVGTTTGEISLLNNPRLVRATNSIPALPKSSFGIRYQLTGVPAGEVVKVTDVVITPGIRDPDLDLPVSYRESRADIVVSGRTVYTGYTFDNAWEAVPGVWKIEVWHGERQLLSQEFNVHKAKPLRN